MKHLIAMSALIVCFAGLPMTAQADDRHGWRGSTGIEWRLGGYRGGSRGYEVYFRYRDGRGWRRAPGSVFALADGWALGTDRRHGGYGIYRWSGNGWIRMPGAAVRIGGSYARPWVINDRGERFIWNGRDWRRDGGAYRRDDRYRYERSFGNDVWRGHNNRNDRYRGRDENRGRYDRNDRNQRNDRNDRGDQDRNRQRSGNSQRDNRRDNSRGH